MSTTQFQSDSHYASRGYLTPWRTDGDRVWTYRLLVSHASVRVWEPLALRSVARHSHLYTRVVSGRESDDVERWFNKEIETPAAEPLRKAIGDDRLTLDDWMRIVRFVAAQDVEHQLGCRRNSYVGSPNCPPCSRLQQRKACVLRRRHCSQRRRTTSVRTTEAVGFRCGLRWSRVPMEMAGRFEASSSWGVGSGCTRFVISFRTPHMFSAGTSGRFSSRLRDRSGSRATIR